MNADGWAAIVQGVATKRGVTYEPIGGLNPRGGPVALCPGGTNRLTGELAPEFWGSSCDADERQEGGLFSKTVLPARRAREGAHARPRAGGPDLQRRVGRAGGADRAGREPSQGRVRVDRLQQAFPRHGAVGPRPGRAARAVQPRLPRLGGPDAQRDRLRDHRSTALLQLAARRAQRRRVRDRARQRRPAVQAAPNRDGGVRYPHLSGRAPGTRGSNRFPTLVDRPRAPSPRPSRRGLASGPGRSGRSASGGSGSSGTGPGRAAVRSRRRACAGRAPTRPPARDQIPADLEVLLPRELGAVGVGGDAGPALGERQPERLDSTRIRCAARSSATGTRTASGKPSGPTQERTAIGWRLPQLLDSSVPGAPPPVAGTWGSAGSSVWPERTSSRCESWISGSASASPPGQTKTRSGRTLM